MTARVGWYGEARDEGDAAASGDEGRDGAEVVGLVDDSRLEPGLFAGQQYDVPDRVAGCGHHPVVAGEQVELDRVVRRGRVRRREDRDERLGVQGERIRRWSSGRGEPRCSTAIAMSASPSSSWVMP